MAEVIGIVSGAITFATVVAQVTESTITINDYCRTEYRRSQPAMKRIMHAIRVGLETSLGWRARY
jgi:hypothetical protein